uniref:Tensin 3 n=1 Tax=Oncorhynchus mykiss TaxID=8022 RepID=A0A8C7T8L4_ONCMY
MEEGYRIDLDYITERIITVSFPQACPDQTYLQNLRDITQMLKSKHGHNYMVINLSEKNDSLTQMNPKVLDTGWLDLLAPSMEQMYGVCKTMDNWLHSHTQHVLVMHCQGGQGRVGVMVASYIHFSSISASADLGLDHFAMRRFYNNKVSSLMNPSQKRYVWMFSSLLKGVMNMDPSPLFLLCVVLHGVPNINSEGGCRLFLRVYQSLQVVCTSAVYHVRAVQTDRVYFVLQPAQLLKGDIMVVCYNKNHQTASREVIFRLQFHTGIIHGRPLLFPKEDLDTAYIGTVVVVVVGLLGSLIGHWQNGPSVIVDYDTWDPLVRRDSYEYISPEGLALPRSPGPVDGNLSARVRKGSSDEGSPFHLATSCPIPSDLKLSSSKDSGLSIASQRTGGITAVSPKRGPSQDELTQLRRLLSGVGLEPHLEDITDLPASCNAVREMEGDEAGLGQPVKASPSERESDILYDDEVSPEASIGSFSSESIPEAQGLVQSGSGYSTPSTQSWVQQQQIVVRGQDSPVDTLSLIGPNTLSLPDMPNRGSGSRESVKRGVEGGVGSPVQTDSHTHASHTTHTPLPSGEPCGQEELASLATDIDESIEQLNQLILDLDPTFIPVPTRHTPLPLALSTSLYTNGNNHTTTHANASQSGKTIFGSVDLSRDERSKGYQSQGDLASLLLGNGGLGLEHSLLKAVEGLGDLDLGLNLGLDLGLGEGRLGGLPPLLPEKRVPGLGLGGSTSPSFSGFSSPHSGSSLSIPFPSAMTPDPLMTSDHLKGLSHTVKFVQDTSKFWYKPDISRDQAITMLKDREPGSFVVRDSHSFRGAYGLAMKVATPPPSVLTQSKKGDLSNELVRHFLIECTQKGVRLKGCPNEPYFGSLTALVCQHSITPLALPCKLIIPDRDPLEETSEPSTQSATNSAAELLKQGAACNVWFLGSVELESLTGYQAVQKAASLILAMDPPSTSTVVHFKVSAQGITLTDNQRKLFFRRHYTVNTVIFCALDPQERKWTRDGCSTAKIFGFVARKSMNGTENVCHLFAEHDPEQPASAIVNFVSKVMIGSPKK